MSEFEIERDEAMGRDYIPVPGGWEVQTKGTGSTLRPLDKKTGERASVPLLAEHMAAKTSARKSAT